MPIIRYKSSSVDDSDYVHLDGSDTLTGDLDLGSNNIVNLADPSSNQDAATKNYVDTAISAFAPETDHSALSNLSADDHTQYLLADGTRAMVGDLDLDSNKIINLGTPTSLTDAVTKEYIDALVATTATAILNLDWQNSVKDKDLITSPAGIVGDRYIINGIGGDWSDGTINDISEYTASGWTFKTPNEGYALWIDDEDKVYIYDGASWDPIGQFITHTNLLGLSADDHPQYVLADGTRAITGSLVVNGNLTVSGLITATTVSGTNLISNNALVVSNSSTLAATTATTINSTTLSANIINATTVKSSTTISGNYMYVGADLEVLPSGNGIILRSEDGTRWRIRVNDAGTLTTASI
jgi:hypothetical protein